MTGLGLVGASLLALGLGAPAAAATAPPAPAPSSAPPPIAAPAGILRGVFGQLPGNVEVPLYTLHNAHGLEVAITPWGATIVAIRVPDRNGRLADIVHGFDSLDGYRGNEPYFGATIGRFGNRIAKGRFQLDGREFTLARNNGDNHLHGGIAGFDKRLWQARELPGRAGPALEMKYRSADGEEGYPGTLDAMVTFTLSDANELRIDYQASTDTPTVVNLTNHTYFNLAGEGDVLGHVLTIHAARYTPVDAGLIPTGELRSVRGTPFDFTTPHAVGERIGANDEQLLRGKGYDHNWVLDGESGALRPAAHVSEPKSGRVLDVLTTEPGLQFYSGNFLDGTIRGKGGRIYSHRSALCLETQHFPDSPNQPGFPSTALRPGQRYTSSTVYRFGTQ